MAKAYNPLTVIPGHLVTDILTLFAYDLLSLFQNQYIAKHYLIHYLLIFVDCLYFKPNRSTEFHFVISHNCQFFLFLMSFTHTMTRMRNR